MRGPIDYIIVGFEGNKFEGKVLEALADAIDKDIVKLVDLSVISKDANGVTSSLDIVESGDDYAIEFLQKYPSQEDVIDEDDISEMSELLENNTSAGLLIVEQLWALPLKQALIDANGVLVAEGRIHPDAASELEG